MFKHILNVQFNAIMSYDGWIIFEYQDKYYVADEDGIFEVELIEKHKSEDCNNDTIDFDTDYSGETDDMQWCCGFNRKEK